MSKGDSRRPVDTDKYNKNYEDIFRKKDKKGKKDIKTKKDK